MYSNTAYEAFYQILGLQFQEEVTHWITSQVIFRAAIILIFGAGVFLFLVHFASRYIPFFVQSRRAPVSKLVGLIFCLFIGISLLKVGATEDAQSMMGTSWSNNPYITSKIPSVQSQFRVSLIFRLLSGSAEEIARAFGFMVDGSFSRTNLQERSPNFFYKAMLGAASDTIDNPELKSNINFYTDECLSKVLPRFNPNTDGSFVDRYFSLDNEAERNLAQVKLSDAPGSFSNCLEYKRYMDQSLRNYAKGRSSVFQQAMTEGSAFEKFKQGFGSNYENWVASNLLVNHYLDNHEGSLGLEHGTELPGTGGRIIQLINRAFSMDGVLSFLGKRNLKGASVAAARSQELSDHFARAPHVAGFIKMLLIGFFPVLVFFLAAGRWKPLLWWWFTYLSICMWNPLWTLLYHVVTSLALDIETLDAFGRLTDGVSLYAASLVSSRLYQAFAVYSWLQLLVGPTFTGSLLLGLKPILSDSEPDRLPDGISTGVGVATKVAGGLG